MKPIQDSRVQFCDGKWIAKCVCGKVSRFAQKHSALLMVNRGNCRNCKKDYRSIATDVQVYKNAEGKWCSTCSGCNKEQAYTRQSHAKQSTLSDWQCKKCRASAKSFYENRPVGNERRLYNKFKKSAYIRNIEWLLTFEEFIEAYNGKCALTGWELSMEYHNTTASLDRIDCSKPYQNDNIQWVHAKVNMCKNKYSQDFFIEICKAVAKQHAGY